MAKVLNEYNGLSAAQIVAKASNTCTLSAAGATINCTDITTSKVKGVIGHYNNDIGGLCSSANVNKYSGFSPREWYVSGNICYNRVKTPYELGSFCGYNHNAITPFIGVNPTFNLDSQFAGTSVDINVSINISETNWKAGTGQNYCHIVVDGSIVNSFDLATYSPLVPKDLTITTTAPAQGGTKTLNIQVWFGTAGSTQARLTELAASTTINVKVAALFANVILVDSTANKAAIAAKCGDGDEYCYYAEAVSNSRTLDSANLYGNYTISAVLYHSNATYSRTIEVPDRVLRANFSSYKINQGNTSATYSIASNYFIINDGSGFSFTIPTSLTPVVDYDMYYLVIDGLH